MRQQKPRTRRGKGSILAREHDREDAGRLRLIGGIFGAVVGSMIPPAVLAIGDTNLIATTICAWLVLGIARLFRFC